MLPDAIADDPFYAPHPRQTVETSAGPCEMPICYYQASLFGVLYRIPIKRAEALLQDTPFEVMPVLGRALVTLCCFDYRATTIGPYGEIGLGIQVRTRGSHPSLFGVLKNPRKQDNQGLYVTSLPVTTEAACAAGCELWGYPKYVNGIKVEVNDEHCLAELDGEFRFEAPTGVGVKTNGLPFITLSTLDDQILRTVIEVDHKVRWGLGGGSKLDILGEGPMADQMRQLGLPDSKPSAMFRTASMRSRLPLGTKLGSTATASQGQKKEVRA